jgi:hypothetical protein
MTMTSTRVTVVYKWTAKPGKLDELQATEQMQLGAEFSTHAFGFDR